MNMEIAKYRASCPNCGHALFRGAPDSTIEGNCPKCRSYLRIAYTSEGVVTSILDGVQKTEYAKIK